MGNQQKHISEADYRRYLNDEMTAEERNAFEKLMQKHPFEAEALEGLQEISVEQFNHDMTELKQRLAGKTQKSNRTIWWAAAASIVILTTSGILWYNLDQRASAPQVAEHTATEKISEKAELDKGKKEDVFLITESPEKGKGSEKSDKNSMGEPEANASLDAEPEDHVEITIAENDLEETEQIDVVESPVKISDAEISGTKPVSKPVNEMVIVEDATIQNQAFEEGLDAEYDFAEPAMSRQAKSLTSGAAQSQITAPTMDAQPMMDMQEFEAWLISQAVLEQSAKVDSVLVVLSLHVDETGKITKFENDNKADKKYFKKARNIIRSGPPWQPAMQNGNPIKSMVEQKVVFRKK